MLELLHFWRFSRVWSPDWRCADTPTLGRQRAHKLVVSVVSVVSEKDIFRNDYNDVHSARVLQKSPYSWSFFGDIYGHAVNILRYVMPISKLYSPGSDPAPERQTGYADLSCAAFVTPASSSIGSGNTIVDVLSPAMLLSVCM